MPQPHLATPHHDGSALYVPDQTPAPGTSVAVRVRVPHAAGVDRVQARVLHDAEPEWFAAEPEHADDHETWWRAEVDLHNPVSPYRFYLDGPAGFGWLTGAGLHRGDVTDAFDFRLPTFPPPPDWVHDAIVYQVFPDRFARSAAADSRPVPDWAVPASWDDPVVPQGPTTPRQLYGGDLDGIVEHLDHVQRLGARVLYLTPFFPSRSCHRYDASRFDQVDPVLGGDEALVRLVRAAHARGLRVVGDLTTNHTGDGNEWFLAARADPTCPEAGFYFLTEDELGYAAWLDVPSLPKLDLRNPELRSRLVAGPGSVVARWLADPYALDGWRIDVANMTGRYRDADVAHEVARDVRDTMAATRPGTWLVAEHGHDASGDLLGDGWHGTMNYAGFTRPVWTWLAAPEPRGGTVRLVDNYLGIPTGYGVPRLTGQAVARTITEVQARLPWRSLVASMNKLDSHDTPRFRTVVGDDPARHEVGVVLLFTMPSAPMVFAGAELGGVGGNGEDSRLPMPWDHPERWDASALAAHERLAALRHSSPALTRGGFRWAHVGADVLTFLRESPSERVLVHVARADHPPVRLPLRALGADAVETLYGAPATVERRGGEPALTLPGAGPAGHVYRLG